MHQKRKRQANRVLAAAVSAAFTANFVPVSVFAEQPTETAIPVAETLESLVTEESVTETDILETNSLESEIMTESETEPDYSREEQDSFEEEIQDDQPASYQLCVNLAENFRDNCRVLLHNSEEQNISVQENESVPVKIEITDEQDKHYQIGAVRIGDIILFPDAAGCTGYENVLQITGDMADENGNIMLAVELIELEEEQEDNTDNTDNIVNNSDQTICKITANQTSGTGEVRFCICDSDKKDHFSPAAYMHGLVIKPNAFLQAKSGQTVIGCIKPKENCYISSVYINGELYQGELVQDSEDWYLFYIDDIAEDVQIEVVIYENQVAELALPDQDHEEKTICYNSDVELKLETNTGVNVPAVDSVTYWFTGEENNRSVISGSDFTGSIIIPKEHNGTDMVVHAEIVYTDGYKITAESDPFSINSMIPEIGITVTEYAQPGDYQAEIAEPGYYWAGRKIKILIDDRADTFPDVEKFIELVTIRKDGELLNYEEKKKIVSYDPTVVSHIDENRDRTVAYLEFTDEGVYSWSMIYMNRAEMQNTGDTTEENGDYIHSFTIDRTEPTGAVNISGKSWTDNIKHKIEKIFHFGIFTKGYFIVAIEAEDINPVKKDYYISHDQTPMRWNALQELPEEEWIAYTKKFPLEDSDRYVIYARLTDASGNRIYLSSDGHIVDHEECSIELTPDVPNENGVYNHDVNILVDVEEKPALNGIYSGIKEVKYWVISDNETTQEGKLFEFEDTNPLYPNLVSKKQNLEITVDAEKNNSYNTVLHVQVTDNAGNTTDKELPLKIDGTSPKISVSYDNTDSRNGIYFKDQRTATISVSEANLNPDDIIITVNDKVLEDLVWQGNQTEIAFQDEGEYLLTVSYTDEAGNPADPISDKFIIDTTKPTGSVTVKENTWYALLEMLTFGIFSNDSLNVSITSEDELSGIEKTEYCFLQIQQGETVLSSMYESPEKLKESLEQLPPEVWKNYENPFAIEKNLNESNVIYVRITDKAGNVHYLGSDGYIFDDEGCEIKITPDNQNARIVNENGKETVYYHDDVTVDLNVSDKFPYSGIQAVKYWVTVNGEITEIQGEYTAESEHLETDKNKICDEWHKQIVIPYNSSDVIIHVEATDFAGNFSHEELLLDIDKTAPEISIRYDNQNGIKDSDGRYYFKESRTATITFTERGNHFSREDAIRNIAIMDIYLGSAEGTYAFGEWMTTAGISENHDDDKHSITIYYFGDANYHFDVSYTDKAGNSNAGLDIGNSVAPHDFTVDTTSPVGSVTAVSNEGRVDTWSEIVDPLSFGFWSKSNIRLTWEGVSDVTSPISAIEYYLSSSVVALTEEQLRFVTNWTEFGILDLSSNIQTTVYVRITDMAGNVSYVSTNALIVDDNAPYDEMLPPDISMTAEQEKSGIYSSDVNVSVTVDEPLVGNAYSGLRTVTYRILNMGQEMESGMLYTFDMVAPQHSDLLKTWQGEITISSELNNSNDVVLEIYAQDNALNTSVERLSLSIDTTPPEIAVVFDQHTSQNGFFKDARTARVNITERNFDKDFVIITATHNQVSYTPDVIWKQDGETWYTDIPFSDDGEYTFDVSCTDLAANKSIAARGTEVPAAFTIDRTKPQVTVVFDAVTAKDNYYQSARTATITIEELNFNKDKVMIHATGTQNQTEVNPVIQWNDRDHGNVHTATVTFSEDAKYHFTMNYTDEAGNRADISYQDENGNPVDDNRAFYIDTIDPDLQISIDNYKKFKPYQNISEVLPVIVYTDANFDEDQVTITMSAAKVEISPAKIRDDTISFILTGESGTKLKWTGKLEDVTDETDTQKIIGKKITFSPLYTGQSEIYKQFDDIYTIDVSVTDKSGRQANAGVEEKNRFSFSINCFGSTYDISAVPELDSYLQEGKEIVITEINPNELTEYSVKLFKSSSDQPQILQENKDYDVISIGKGTEWHKYIYKIHKDIFEDGGKYEIRLYSKDKAGNDSNNEMETKDSNIRFFIDKEAPTAIVANLKSNETYYVQDEKMTVLMVIYDNYALEEVNVYLDDDKNIYQSWNTEEIEEAEYNEFRFEIQAESENFWTNNSHKLTVICKDASGRENEPVIIDNFKIITGEYRKPWIYAGISAATILTAGTTVAIVRKRKIIGSRI